jgi:hypothetical protein
VFTILRRTVGLWWRTWPWLVAIYLTGWFLRYWALQLAIHVGLVYGNTWGNVVLSLAPLLRLLTYLAMFVVLRSAAPGLQMVETGGAQPRGVYDVVASAILPFLVVYTAWKLIMEDQFIYEVTVRYTKVTQLQPGTVSVDVMSDAGLGMWLAVAIAFGLRELITRFRDRLPRWTMLIAAYLEVLWLFLVFRASAAAVFGTPRWIAQRRVMVWFAGIRDDVFSRVAWLADWWNAAGSVLGSLVSVLALALAWLAIAGVVYGTPLPPTWAGARRVLLGDRAGSAVGRVVDRGRRTAQARWQRLPTEIRARVAEFGRAQLGRFGPIVDAARLILHGGAVPIAFFVLAYTALVLLAPNGAYFSKDVTDGYLWRAVALLIGPHDWPWWQAYAQTIRAAVGAVIDPIRIALVAAAYWYCVGRVRVEHTAVESGSVEADHP